MINDKVEAPETKMSFIGNSLLPWEQTSARPAGCLYEVTFHKVMDLLGESLINVRHRLESMDHVSHLLLPNTHAAVGIAC